MNTITLGQSRHKYLTEIILWTVAICSRRSSASQNTILHSEQVHWYEFHPPIPGFGMIVPSGFTYSISLKVSESTDLIFLLLLDVLFT